MDAIIVIEGFILSPEIAQLVCGSMRVKIFLTLSLSLPLTVLYASPSIAKSNLQMSKLRVHRGI